MYKSLIAIGSSGFVSPPPEQFECIVKLVVQATWKILAKTDFNQPRRPWRQAEGMLGTAENFIFKALYIDFDENRLAAKSGIHDNIEGADWHDLVPFIGRSRPARHERRCGVAAEQAFDSSLSRKAHRKDFYIKEVVAKEIPVKRSKIDR